MACREETGVPHPNHKKEDAMFKSFRSAAMFGGIALALFILALCASDGWASGRPAALLVVSPERSFQGKTLGQWLTLYWAWFNRGQNPATNDGRVYFMPLPNALDDDPDDGVTIQRGHLDITIPEGTPFVLPIVGWISERYTPESGIPDDADLSNACFDPKLDPRGCFFAPIPASKFNAIHVWVTLDGERILDNTSRFYVEPTAFDPPVVYDAPTSYGSTATIRHQTIGFIAKPLPVGVHHITNYVDYGPLSFFFDNSWTITVVPR